MGAGDHHRRPSSSCVIGGLGSFWGVVLAALLVGVVKGAITGAGYPQASDRRDLLPDAARAAVAAARPVRRAHPAVRVGAMTARRDRDLARSPRCALLRAAVRCWRAHRPRRDLGDRGRDLRASPAWRSTSWSATPGLVSFGHGAWFGLAAYAAGDRAARPVPGRVHAAGAARRRRCVVAASRASFGFADPAPARRLLLAADARAVGDALRRSPSAGPTVTGGEDGLGGITRPVFVGVSFDEPRPATTRWSRRSPSRVVCALWRFHRSPARPRAGRDPRERAARALRRLRDADRYKLLAFVISATLTGLAGMLLLFNNRMTSADPISRRRSRASCSPWW